MAPPVKSNREYHSPRRQQQAAATRRSILDAANELFERQGYPATTMAEIAARAGVALKTVYVAFSTKSQLLRALWDLLLKGDQEQSPVADRPWYRQVLEEPDPRQQLLTLAASSCVVKRRIGGILRVVRTAAPVDADSGDLWRLIQSDFHANQRAVVESLAGKGALRAELDVARATDILWTLNHPDTWLLLVGDRGWSPQEFERWLAETACQQLLNDEAGAPASTASARRTTDRQRR
jgi:AcrR family transcriptional regulator